MAVTTFRNAYLLIDTFDYTTYAPTISLDESVQEIDTTAMTHTGMRRAAGAIKDSVITAEILVDLVDNTTEERLAALVGAADVAIQFGVNGSTPAAATPVYKGNVKLFGRVLPLKVGDVSRITAAFKISDGVALDRDVTP